MKRMERLALPTAVRRKAVHAVSLICVLGLLSVLAAPLGERPIKVGAILGISGPVAGFSTEIKDGLLLAAEVVKETKHLTFDVTIEDSKYDPKMSVSALQKLANIDNIKIIFVSSTPPVVAVKPLAESRGVLVLGLAGYAGFLEGTRTMLNFANNGESDAAIMAGAIVQSKPARVAEVYMQSDWGENYHVNFQREVKRNPGIEYESLPHLPGETDFRAVLAKLLKGKPGAVLVNSMGGTAGLIIKQLSELRFEGRIYANQGFVLSTDALEVIKGMRLPNFYYQTYADPPEAFTKMFEARYGKRPGMYALIGYTYMEFLADAIETIGPDPLKLAAHMKSVKEFKGRYMTPAVHPTGSIVVETIVKRWQ